MYVTPFIINSVNCHRRLLYQLLSLFLFPVKVSSFTYFQVAMFVGKPKFLKIYTDIQALLSYYLGLSLNCDSEFGFLV